MYRRAIRAVRWFARQTCLLLINFYRYCISPVIGPRCRFYPTCSQYAHTAIEQHGVGKGVILSVWRLLRCNPFNRGGVDPVPEKKN